MKRLLPLLIIACGRPVATPQPSPVAPETPALPEVMGHVDGLAQGWALAPAFKQYPIDVALFVDGENMARVTVHANEPRADVNMTTGIDGDHGFTLQLPASLDDGQSHQLHFFGLGTEAKVELGGSPLTYQHAAACATAGPKVAPTDSEYVVTLKAVNGKRVSAACGGDDVGLVTADQDTEGERETFYIAELPGGFVSIRSSHGRLLSAELAGGHELHANRTALGPWEQFHLEGWLVDGAKVGFRANDGAHWVTARIDHDPIDVMATADGYGPWEQFEVHVIVSPVHQRHGVVRAESRSFVDDDGTFYPLGGTLMWALYGWKNEPDRVKQNLQYLARYHFDYVRILGEVDWAGEEIDPSWPDYAELLGSFIDYAYDQCGLRVELTLVGGRGDPMVLAQKAVPVITANRQHKILDIEVANESYGRPITLQQMQAAGAYLRMSTPNLVALSSGEGLSTYVSTITDWRASYVSVYMPAASANLGTIHMDRTYGDDGWRETRQPWDWKDYPFPVSHNEPIGPRSSVAEETNPLRLATLRAVGLINGVGAFVLHNGAGVSGRVDPAHNRPANLWEVPGIDDVMAAVRGIDAWMPQRAGEGQHWNNGWAGDPWLADAFWTDGSDHGVNRNYTVATPDGWISTEAGVKSRVVLTAARKSRVEIFDMRKGKTGEVVVNAGATYTLTPDSLDDKGYGAFVIVGHYL